MPEAGQRTPNLTSLQDAKKQQSGLVRRANKMMRCVFSEMLLTTALELELESVFKRTAPGVR